MTDTEQSMSLEKTIYNLSKGYKETENQILEQPTYALGYPTNLLTAHYIQYDQSFNTTFLEKRNYPDIKNKPNIQEIIDVTPMGLVTNTLFSAFLNNVGSPYTHSETAPIEVKKYEVEVIEMWSKYFGMEPNNTRGYIASGKSESNMAALAWHILYWKNQQSTPSILYTTQTSHKAILTLENLCQIEIKSLNTNKDGSMDLDHLKQLVANHPPLSPIILNTNLGLSLHSGIDNIPAIKNILDQSSLQYSIHMDTSFLGAVIQSLKPFGNQIQNYFTDLGVSTIAVSGNEFLQLPQKTSVICVNKIFLEKAFASHNISIECVGKIDDITFSGSRSGHSTLLLHYWMHILNMHENYSGINQLYKASMKNADYLYAHLQTIFDAQDIEYVSGKTAY